MFKKATKEKLKLRMALIGPSGSGKTYSALAIGTNLGSKVAVIDTERGSARIYADTFNFDVLELESFAPAKYIEAIRAAGDAGYDVLIIDSLSHAWMGRDGVLDFVDRKAKQSNSSNTFAAWRDASPLHNQLVDALLSSPCHLIVTMRAKTEYVMEVNERGKTVPRKVGTAPQQRDGIEYEFSVAGEMSIENDLVITKTRCAELNGRIFNKPGREIAETLLAWLNAGETSQSKLNPNQARITKIRTILTELFNLGDDIAEKELERDFSAWGVKDLDEYGMTMSGRLKRLREELKAS